MPPWAYLRSAWAQARVVEEYLRDPDSMEVEAHPGRTRAAVLGFAEVRVRASGLEAKTASLAGKQKTA
jgi:hypothetical protein